MSPSLERQRSIGKPKANSRAGQRAMPALKKKAARKPAPASPRSAPDKAQKLMARAGKRRSQEISRNRPAEDGRGARPESQVASQKAQSRNARTAGSDQHFAIVGIGASAGGLEAMTQFLRHLPRDPGMAFVLIQHLD